MTPVEMKARANKKREQAKNKELPQDVRNQFLDDANKLEKEAAGIKLAKGGAVKKKMAVGGAMPSVMPAKPAGAYAKGGAVKEKAKPALAIVIGVGKPKAMAKGGMNKKGKC